MLRSQILHLMRLLQSKANLSAELGLERSCDVLKAKVVSRNIHLSCTVKKDDSQDSKAPPAEKKQSEGIPLDEELHSAAIDAAKVLPGDWNKTADILLSRLSAHRVVAQEDGDIGSQPVASVKPKQTLLGTLKVSKTDERQRRSLTEEQEKNYYEEYSVEPKRRVSLRKTQKPFMDIFEVPRLGIFDADKVKSQMHQQQPVIGKGLWEEKDDNLVRLAQGGIPRNAWEEQIEWTKQGKLWTFPIDNDADKHVERQYKFHDHVFLERHLGNDFPATGPIRKFMSLVCLGLSQSHWFTVPEKIEHIRWFVGYFKEKQEVLEATIPGEEGRMPDNGNRIKME